MRFKKILYIGKRNYKKIAIPLVLGVILIFGGFTLLNRPKPSINPYPEAKIYINTPQVQVIENNPERAQLVSFPSEVNTLKFRLALGRPASKKQAIIKKSYAAENKNVWESGESRVEAYIVKGKKDQSRELAVSIAQEGADLSLAITRIDPYRFTPGNYTLRVTLSEEGFERSIEQDFTWGVMAINTDKSVYDIGETAEISIGVLDNAAAMVCNANLELRITNQELGIDDVLSTDKGTIIVNPECKIKAMVEKPDYEAEYKVGKAGKYKMTLTATTPNGIHIINDGFEVQDNPKFDITRNSATRIYPVLDYDMNITVKANENFDGQVVEKVPGNFKIKKGISDTYSVVVKEGKTSEGQSYKYQEIVWDLKLSKNGKKELAYIYDAPNKNPEFYLLGPLSLYSSNEERSLFSESRQWQIAVDDSATEEVDPNADNGAQAWTCTAGSDGNCGTGHYTVVDDTSASPSTSGYISTGTGGDTGEIDAWDATTFTPDSIQSVTNVTAYIYAQSATNANGSTLDDVQISVYMGGAYQTNVAVTPVYNSWAWYSASFNGAWTQSDIDNLRIRVTRTKQGSGNPANQDDNVQIAASYAEVTYTYAPPPEELTQEGYTFENDDEDQATGDANDDNTVQAGGSFSSGKTLTSVKKGERVTVRAHVKNTGGPQNSNLALFYDRNDGIFTKVENTATESAEIGDCTNTDWECELINDFGTNAGYNSSIAISPSGEPWIVYTTDNDFVAIARYVGSGGRGCKTSSKWSCENVTSTRLNQGSSIQAKGSIAFYNGKAYISYYSSVGSGALGVAEYVGTGGNCTSTAWNCTTVDSGTSFGQYSTIAFDNSGNPWVSYHDDTSSSVKVAEYVGTGGNCTSTAWNCTAIETGGGGGYYPSITFDNNDTAWVSYHDAVNLSLKVAKYVGGGSGSGCTSNDWTCTIVDDHASHTLGGRNSIGTDPSGNIWISYKDSSNNRLKVANYVVSGGTCNDSPQTGSDEWDCTVVDDPGNLVGDYSSIAFAPDGHAWVIYLDDSADSLKVARYVGSGGSGCTSSAWTCSVIDDPSNAVSDASFNSIVFDQKGIPWVSFLENSTFSLKVANLVARNDMLTSPALSGTNADVLSASHADMTSATDSSGKSDADCMTATTWNDGLLYGTEEVPNGLDIPDGSSTSQCSEVAFTIDTSQAIASTTYRFVVATDDSVNKGRGRWRGPISVGTNGYPTLTIEPDATTPIVKFTKDNMPVFSNCTDTTWGCETIDNSGDDGTFWIGLTIDSNGTPFVSYYDVAKLKVAKYVGSGGNCTSSKWNCDIIDTNSANNGANSSIASGKNGQVWVAYRNVTGTSLKVATNFDSPTMSACTATGWDCTTVDSTGNLGFESSIAVDKAGNPWISYRDSTNGDLRVAWYVGSGGNCTDTAWSCVAVDTSAALIGDGSSIAFDDFGKAWISYYDSTNTNLKVANFVGIGGNCSSTLWNCETVDADNTNGEYTSLAINPVTNLPWVAYYSLASSNVTKVANFVGGSGGNCSGNASWNCTVVTASSPVGSDPSIAFDPSGNAWFNYFRWTSASDRDMTVARYVGSGGNCASAAWSCSSVDATVANVGEYGSNRAFAFDQSGTPWVAYRDNTNSSIKIAKKHLPPVNSLSRYMLSAGKAPATESGSCTATADNEGYCGVEDDDTNYDSIISLGTQRSMGVFAVRSSSNSTAPTGTWIGRTNLAPSTGSTAGDIMLEIYRFGSTNGWEALDSETASADCSTVDCTVTAQPVGTTSEYFEADGSNYWTFLRVYQIGDGSTTVTFKTDQIYAFPPEEEEAVSTPKEIRGGVQIRGGTTF